jgi:periplasmic protein TonB
MFDNTLNSSWDERSRRGLTALTSFGLQSLAVAFLLILPLLRPTGLPSLRPLSTPVSIGDRMEEPPATRPHASANTAPRTDPADITLREPSQIPSEIATSDDGPPQVTDFGPPTSGPAIRGDLRGMRNPFGGDSRPVVPVVAPPAAVAPVRISHISEGNLLRKMLPTYPPLARSARIQGQVVLQAVIGKQGSIENLRVVSGHPMLVPAAIDAVRQWLYRPYVLNGEPVEVETQITVNFSLGGN